MPLPVPPAPPPLPLGPPLPPFALAFAAPLDPDPAVALDGPFTVIARASALPVLPDVAVDCADPPCPWDPAAPLCTTLFASPVDPEEAPALELLPVSVRLIAFASPVLPDWERADEPALDELDGTLLSPATALPVSPEAACPELAPIGATDSAVAEPELPDCAPAVGGGSWLSLTSVRLLLPDCEPSEPDGVLRAAPVLPAAALPALPDLADASALPMPLTARAVASPELPDCADELCAGSLDPVLTAGAEPEDPGAPPPALPPLSVAPPALPDSAFASAEPVGASATAAADPELPECAEDGPGFDPGGEMDEVTS